MSRLLISSRHLTVVEMHARAAYPEECCGVLIGRFLDDERLEAQVDRVLAARNGYQEAVDTAGFGTTDSAGGGASSRSAAETAKNRYLIPPQTVISAHQHARQQGMEVIGYYHSHPNHPARPSEQDLEHAWAGLSYLIVSVTDGRLDATRSWRLSQERDRFEEQRLEAAGMPPAATARRAAGR